MGCVERVMGRESFKLDCSCVFGHDTFSRLYVEWRTWSKVGLREGCAAMAQHCFNAEGVDDIKLHMCFCIETYTKPTCWNGPGSNTKPVSKPQDGFITAVMVCWSETSI